MRSFRSVLPLVTLVLLFLGLGCSGFEQGIGHPTASLVTLEVTPASASLAKGTTVALTATGIYSDQTTRDLTASVIWSSSDTTVATVSNAAGSAGMARGTGVGSTTITATLDGVTDSVPLRVTTATLVSIGVTPAIPTIALGMIQPFTATGVFSDASTQDLTGSATWTSSDPATATVSNTLGSRGLATGRGVNTATITATYEGVSGRTTLRVTAAILVSIAVTPGSPSIAKGTHQPFTATGTFTDASTQDLTTSASWSSSDPATATISNTPGSCGLATGTGVNTTTIAAAYAGIIGSTTLTVTAADLVSIAVTPASASIAKGTHQPFTATGTFTDATTQDLTASALWSSANTSAATISNAAASRGVATGAEVGDTTITASVGTVSGSTPFSVTAATLVSIAVTPATPSIAKGTTRQFTATGTYTDASTQDLTASLTWTSSDTTYATISTADGSRGLATSLLEGTSTIKAANGTLEGTTLATVCTAIVYPDTAPVTVSSVDLLVIPGRTVIIDGSALTGSNTLTWNGAAETDGAFYFKAGASTAVLTGGSGNDSFDFTTTGVVFNSADHVDGKGGANTLMLGQVSGATPLANVANIQVITFASPAPVSVTTTDALVPAGATLTVDASALSGSNSFTWDGSAESNGTFHITTGASAATVTGGSGDDLITGGAGANILNGGPGNDTINGGSGTNAINGGAGSDTIHLGTHTGKATIYLSNPISGADTITGFVPIAATHDIIYVGQSAGLWFVDGTATNVQVGAPAIAMVVTASGPMVFQVGANMLILADATYPDSTQVVAALVTGGSDELTFTHDLGDSSELLVVYSDGTNVRVVGINLTPSGRINAGNSFTTTTFTDLATIPGFTTADLANWTAGDFHF